MKEHTRLHEDNLSYWSQRSASYSDVNKGELAGISRHSWSAVLHDAISSHYPGRPAESIRVLDIGTGPGFFAIVLVGTMLAYAIYLRGVALCGTVKASLMGVAEPISGTVISALWLGTVFSGWDFLGGALIIAMMIIVALSKS